MGNYGVHGGAWKGEKGEAEELTGMLWCGKSTMDRQLRGGGGGDHKSPARGRQRNLGVRRVIATGWTKKTTWDATGGSMGNWEVLEERTTRHQRWRNTVRVGKKWRDQEYFALPAADGL
jgi:hypothetical protein